MISPVMTKPLAPPIPTHLSAIDWQSWVPHDFATLLFVFREHSDEVLLIRKKRGLGAGKINGPGGRLEPGETPRACAIREVDRVIVQAEPVGECLDAGGVLFELSHRWIGR
jgi:hypothetical protein